MNWAHVRIRGRVSLEGALVRIGGRVGLEGAFVKNRGRVSLEGAWVKNWREGKFGRRMGKILEGG